MTTQQLATTTDFANFGFANYGLSLAQQNAELLAASADVIDAISERYTPPYSTWGTNLTRAVCAIGAWNMLCVRGFDPTSPADVSVKDRFDYYTNAKDGWLLRVNKGEITLNDLLEANGAKPEDDIALGGDGSDTGRFELPDSLGNTIDMTVTP